LNRIIALDFGVKRTGVAVTDPMQIIASGLETVETALLIPYLKILALIPKLMAAFPGILIERQDERFTSKMAVQAMIAGGMKKKKRQEKGMIDQISATIILQAYLNRIS
jgi:putative Holliday junction resolvase